MLQETEQKSLDMELRGKLEGCNQQMEEYKVKGYTYTPFILCCCTHQCAYGRGQGHSFRLRNLWCLLFATAKTCFLDVFVTGNMLWWRNMCVCTVLSAAKLDQFGPTLTRDQPSPVGVCANYWVQLAVYGMISLLFTGSTGRAWLRKSTITRKASQHEWVPSANNSISRRSCHSLNRWPWSNPEWTACHPGRVWWLQSKLYQQFKIG